MKNKWFLTFGIVLMIFINNGAFAQDDGYEGGAAFEEGGSDRTKFQLPGDKGWINDPYDLVYSAKQEKLKDSILNTEYFHKASDQTIDSLIAVATSKTIDIYSRNNALEYLSNIDSKRQIPAIEKMISSETCDTCLGVRWKCIDALIRLNSISSIPLLIKVLDKEIDIIITDDDRLWIALFLAANGEKNYSFKTLKSLWGAKLGLKNVCHTGFMDINTPESINIIRNDMNYMDPVVALDAAACMAELNYKDEAFPILKELLNNEDFRIKMGTMKVLTYYIGDDKSFDLIKHMLNDKDSNVKWYCQAILNKYKIK